MSAILEFLTELFRFFRDLFVHKREEKNDLWQQIEETRNKLVLALEEGRITDVAIFRKELEKLMDRYSKYTKSLENDMKKKHSTFYRLSSVLFVLALATGCVSGKKKSDTTVFVLGDRINIVEPGDELTVPELTPPAKQWYLVDNVGLQHWLGISVSPDKKDTATRTELPE